MEDQFTNQSDVVSCDTLSQRDQRSLVFHLLYAMDSFDYDVSLESIIENFAHNYDCIVQRNDAVFEAAQAVIEKREELDKEIQPLLANWRFERLGVATRLILRYAFWELLNTDTDQVVIINEAVELTKCFAEDDAYKFVNGVLDEWRKKQDSSEL